MMKETRIRELINRIARLDAAGGWREDLNPTQVRVLEYLHRANRFSCSPSHVADYLGSTRGTVSQTLKSLVTKGYVTEQHPSSDKRVVSYGLTKDGSKVATSVNRTEEELGSISATKKDVVERELTSLLHRIIAPNNQRPFGLCRQCKHHRVQGKTRFCELLGVPLTPIDADKICHEQEPSSAT